MHPQLGVSQVTVDLLTPTYDLSKIWQKNENFVETEDMKLKEIVPETVLAFKNKKVIDLIHETQGSNTFVYQVMAPGNEPHYRYSDPFRKLAQESDAAEDILLLQQRYIILNELKKNLSRNLGDRIIV